MMTDEDMERLVQMYNRIGTEFARILPDVQRMYNQLHNLLFPEQHKRLMLRESRQRARLSTQRRRTQP